MLEKESLRWFLESPLSLIAVYNIAYKEFQRRCMTGQQIRGSINGWSLSAGIRTGLYQGGLCRRIVVIVDDLSYDYTDHLAGR